MLLKEGFIAQEDMKMKRNRDETIIEKKKIGRKKKSIAAEKKEGHQKKFQ